MLDAGPVVAWFAVIASLLTQVTATSTDIGPIPAVLAVIALAIGIPHGAADNLTLVHTLSWRGWIRMGVGYLTIAALAAAVIIILPAFGFILVLGMTVWHFGAGDVEARTELSRQAPVNRKFRILYALALGSAPVLLPLTSPAALSTVTSLEPQLAQIYAGPATTLIRGIVAVLLIVTILVLINRSDLRGAFELFTLGVLGFVVSPFIAFAVYFSFWHAARHTARLAQVSTGAVTIRSMAAVTRIGIPSLLGFIAILVILTVFMGNDALTGTVLWVGLAIVWGLTVPHMWFVSRFDSRLRATRQ